MAVGCRWLESRLVCTALCRAWSTSYVALLTAMDRELLQRIRRAKKMKASQAQQEKR